MLITGADSPAVEPRNCPSAGTKSPVDSPCRYSSGNTSVIFGVLRHHGGRIAEANRRRSPGVGVDAAVVHPRHGHLDRARAGQDLAGLVGAVAHHQPASALVALVDELGDVGVDLGLQRLGQHPAGALADEFVDQHRPVGTAGVIGVGSSRNYGEHGSYLPDRRWRADLA